MGNILAAVSDQSVLENEFRFRSETSPVRDASSINLGSGSLLVDAITGGFGALRESGLEVCVETLGLIASVYN